MPIWQIGSDNNQMSEAVGDGPHSTSTENYTQTQEKDEQKNGKSCVV